MNTSFSSRSSLCPACDRFIGSTLQCPYCGSETHQRRSLLRLRWAALVLTAIGFGVLILS